MYVCATSIQCSGLLWMNRYEMAVQIEILFCMQITKPALQCLSVRQIHRNDWLKEIISVFLGVVGWMLCKDGDFALNQIAYIRVL